MNTEDQALIKKIRDAEHELAKGIQARNDGMTQYRKAQKAYSAVIAEAAAKLIGKGKK